MVKVLETTRNSVRCGRSAASVSASSWPSRLLTKCTRRPGVRKGVSACTAMRGPRSEPPMPMLTTSVMAESARTRSAKASRASRVASTARCESASAAVGQPAIRLPSPGARSNGCSAARPSVVLTASPANKASRCASRPQARARANNCTSASASMRLRERSANTPGADWLSRAKRAASCANASRTSKPVCAARRRFRVAHSGVSSQRGRRVQSMSCSRGVFRAKTRRRACAHRRRRPGCPRPAFRWPWRPR